MQDELAHLVGVIEDIKHPFNTRFMFPSKVGGKPAWMIPEKIPEIRCDSCSNHMTFLLQLYAPDSESETAFHRSLMLFICLKCRCFLKCFRSQLPLGNPFYPPQIISPSEVPNGDLQIELVCCDSCGVRKHSTPSCRPLPEFGLEIEEIDEINMDDDDENESSGEVDDDTVEKSVQMFKQDVQMDIEESEMSLFNDFTETALEHDSSFRMFKRFVEECPVNQVLYYSLGGSPIWISDEKQLDRSAPSCENCGGVRRFEFQIQPQLIYHLMKRLKGFPVDAAPFEWGVVSVYTCVNNCSDGPYYKEEFVYNQLEPAEWLEFDSRRKVDFTKDKQAGKEAPQISKNEDSDDGEWI